MKILSVLILSFSVWAKDADLSRNDLRVLLRKVSTQKSNCEKKNCDGLKQLKQMQKALQQHIVLDEKISGVSEENRTLRLEVKVCQDPNSLSYRIGCDKNQLRRELFLDHGIPENGSEVFPKNPIQGANAVCWSNSRKKKESSVTLCEFPLALTVMTKGGTKSKPTIRQREYFFDPSQCLTAVRIVDENVDGKTVSELNYKECLKEWGNKNFTDLDKKLEVRKVDIIGACFRYYLLPPREEKAGRANPEASQPPPTEVSK